jgi:hypothetical protein
VPRKIEIWRTPTKAEQATELARQAGAFGSQRVKAVWRNFVAPGAPPSYFLAANLAGLRSGVAPHQGLTNVEISGADGAVGADEYFDADELDVLAEAGVWIVVQDPDGTVKTRHAVTTDPSSIETREETMVANLDAISYFLLRRLRPFIGIMNVTPTAISRINVELVSAIEFLKANGFAELLGGQLIDGVVVELRAHATLADTLVAVVELTRPYPLNSLNLFLVG